MKRPTRDGVALHPEPLRGDRALVEDLAAHLSATPATSRWLAAPDGPGRWWRDARDGIAPSICTVTEWRGGLMLAVPGAYIEIPAGSRWHRAETPPAEPHACGTTHHTGCACWEARRNAALASLSDEVMQRRAERGTAMRERDALRALHEMDAARIAALESALREAYEAHRSCYGRALWCGRCGAEWGTQHVGDCPVGRALRVLDGGER